MFKRHPQLIEQLVKNAVRNNGLETPLLQLRLLNAWDEVVGPVVARYTTEKKIQNQTLMVRLQNPALRSELSMMRTDIMQKLNQKVGANVIYDIRFF